MAGLVLAGPVRVGVERAGTLWSARQDEQTRTRSKSFGEIATDYDRFRPGPPDEAVDCAARRGPSRCSSSVLEPEDSPVNLLGVCATSGLSSPMIGCEPRWPTGVTSGSGGRPGGGNSG